MIHSPKRFQRFRPLCRRWRSNVSLFAIFALGTATVFPLALPAFGQVTILETPPAARSPLDPGVARIREAYRDQPDGPGRAELPVGVFDSGTGGLAVLEDLLKLDVFDNRSGQRAPGGDGTPDFDSERFVFLADQANMPYGNYGAAGRTDFLMALIRNDAMFLLGREYFASVSAEDRTPRHDKRPVKAIVIACNTATAYGLSDLESLVSKAGVNVPVIGVIDAASRGALDCVARHSGGAIGVLATRGTVATGAYPKAVRRLAAQQAFADQLDIVQQGSLGLAGAIDGAAEFIVSGAVSNRPRAEYRGPSFSNAEAPIDPRILPRYGFDFSENRMLVAGNAANTEILHINSIENYIRYDVVELLESIRRQANPRPLRAIILGCTHFPYYAKTFQAELQRLRDYREQDRFVYRDLIASDVELINPAAAVGIALYETLCGAKQLSGGGALPPGETRAEFFITAPRPEYPGAELDSRGWFTYEYKYGRDVRQAGQDVRIVPLVPQRLDPAAVERLQRDVPEVWMLLREFRDRNAKAGIAENP